MKIKIVEHVPTMPSPVIGEEYEVVRINERTNREGGNIYFVKCEGQEIGVLSREMVVVRNN